MCTCHDCIICDYCTSQQIEATASTVVNPLLEPEEIEDLTLEVTTFFRGLITA